MAGVIEILSPSQVARARETGALVADVLYSLRDRATVGTNLLQIDAWAKEMILGAGATSCYVDYAPSFGRGPFGHYICTSVNDGVLHGLPHDYDLRDGDLLSLDLAVVLGGVAADSAISFVVGDSRPAESLRLIETTQRALATAIETGRPGREARRRVGGDRRGAARRRLLGEHRLRRPRHRHDHAPGPARAQRRPGRARDEDAPGQLLALEPWVMSDTPTSWSPTTTAGPCAAPPAAAPRTASTPWPSPRTASRSSPSPPAADPGAAAWVNPPGRLFLRAVTRSNGRRGGQPG